MAGCFLIPCQVLPLTNDILALGNLDLGTIFLNFLAAAFMERGYPSYIVQR